MDETTPGRSTPAGATNSRVRYLPGLDGLRAIAVIGVLLYHAGVSWLPGGFLGVDLFFVISGFLITSLLVAERRQAGAIRLGAFYLRRARRLLPALFAMLGALVVFMAAFHRGDLAQARGDIGAALGYFSNWWYVWHHRSYFVAAGRPGPLEHLWSLAVEEQFYLIWPAVLIVLLRGRAAGRRVFTAATAGALASTAWMTVLAVRGNVPFDTDSSRVYFGTDTHAMGLLLGAAAAVGFDAVHAKRRHWLALPWVRRCADLLGALTLAALCWQLHAISYFSPGLYRGGFLAIAALGAVVVVAASLPAGRLGAALGIAPLRWIGARSYGLYLWHWPVFVYTRPGLDWPVRGNADLAIRLAITAGLTEASYRLVEQPIRRLGVRGWLAWLRTARTPMSALGSWLRRPAWRIAAPGLAAALVVVLALGAAVLGGAHSHATTAAHANEQGAPASAAVSAPVVSSALVAASSTPASPLASPPASSTWSATPRVTPSAHDTPTQHATHAAPPAGADATTLPPIAGGPPPSLTAVGDSIMEDAKVALQQACPHTEVYAAIGLQPSAILAEVQKLHDAGHLGADVVIEAGTNGVVSSKELDATLTLLADKHKVVVVNDFMARQWEAPNDAMFPAVVAKHPNATLVDWHAVAAQHPEYLTKDGVHLQPAARSVYAALIKTAAAC